MTTGLLRCFPAKQQTAPVPCSHTRQTYSIAYLLKSNLELGKGAL